jgi:uncharacterized protein YgbK (DUF1537 family)
LSQNRYKDLSDDIAEIEKQKKAIVEQVKADYINSCKHQIGDRLKNRDLHSELWEWSIVVKEIKLFISGDGTINPYAIGRKLNQNGLLDSRTKKDHKILLDGNEKLVK